MSRGVAVFLAISGSRYGSVYDRATRGIRVSHLRVEAQTEECARRITRGNNRDEIGVTPGIRQDNAPHVAAGESRASKIGGAIRGARLLTLTARALISIHRITPALTAIRRKLLAFPDRGGGIKIVTACINS